MTRTELLQLHDETCQTARSIMERKNNDYAGGKDSSDPFANFKMAASIGIHPVTGLLLRMMDKVQRIRTFTLDGGLAVSGESVDDACDDIVNYAILCKGLLREERASKPNPDRTDEEIRSIYLGQGKYGMLEESGVPDGLLPLPPVPEGFDRWVYRGTGWTNDRKQCTYACYHGRWAIWSKTTPAGNVNHHYIEAVKD